MATAAILGTAGYSGQETLDRVLAHPGLELVALGSDSLAGRPAGALDPRLNGSTPGFVANREAAGSGAGVLFLCLDNGEPVTFVPHLLPVKRGLLATCYVQTGADARGLLEAKYAGSRVVRVLPEGVVPELARVQGTDTAELGIFTDASTGTTIVICALDNL